MAPHLGTWPGPCAHAEHSRSKVVLARGEDLSSQSEKNVPSAARGRCDQASVSVADLKAEIDKLATEYMSSARSLSPEEKLALLRQIQEAYGKCKEFGDDKVQLAMQTYEMVRAVAVVVVGHRESVGVGVAPG